MIDKRKILIVEDNALNQMIAKTSLEKAGFVTEIAENGKIAAEKVLNNNYFLILMDCMMPEMDGFEATKEIRKNEKNKNFIIALTGAETKSEIDKCYEAGMDSYIKKPLNIEVLENIIKLEKMPKINSSIFREYDIRGEVGVTLFEEDAYYIGKAFASYIIRNSANKKIAVCYDGRLSSPTLEAKLVEGLKSAGADIIRIGMGPTPMLYFSVYEIDAAGGIMLTGSHNPKNHNGFKMMQGKASLYGKNIKELERIITEENFLNAEGKVTLQSFEDKYINKLAADLKNSGNTIRVAWDPGNGAAGNIVKKLTKQIPGKHFVINDEVDGNFPNHHPDPTIAKNLEQLIETVKENKCDVGVAFDGDGDRLGIVDSKGRILWGDQLLLIFAKDLLERKPGSKVIADVKASQTLFDEVKKLGGEPIMWKTGHSLVKAKMQETKTELAGEMSGHVFIADGYYGFDDGVFAAIRLIKILSKSKKTLSEILDEMPKTFNTPEFRINCTDDKKFNIIKEISTSLKKENANFSDIDGVRVNENSGWWLIRASNTQAAIVARCEASSEHELIKIKSKLSATLEKYGLKLSDSAAH